jgi:hypothetical protein
MAKLIIHPPGTTREQIEEERLLRNLERSPEERMKLMFKLNAIALMLKKGPIKLPQGKGVILKKN